LEICGVCFCARSLHRSPPKKKKRKTEKLWVYFLGCPHETWQRI